MLSGMGYRGVCFIGKPPTTSKGRYFYKTIGTDLPLLKYCGTKVSTGRILVSQGPPAMHVFALRTSIQCMKKFLANFNWLGITDAKKCFDVIYRLAIETNFDSWLAGGGWAEEQPN